MVDDIVLIQNSDVSVVAEEADVATVSAETSSVIITDQPTVPGPEELPAPTNVPVFKAILGLAGQTPVVNTWTKVNCNLKQFDTENYFDVVASRFTPRIAGHYLLMGSVSASTLANGYIGAGISKNGAREQLNAVQVASTGSGQLLTGTITYFNGSTDYAELLGYSSGSPPFFYGEVINGPNPQCSFEGSLVRAWSQDLGTLEPPGLPLTEDGIVSISDGRRIININGNAEVSQELGTTGATLVNAAGFKYIADMWQAIYNHAAATAVITSAKILAASFPAPLVGFPSAFQVKATTALSAPANTDYVIIRVKVEGYRVACLGWGAANPKPLSYGFWFYTTISGVMFVRVVNNSGARSYHHEHVVVAGWNWCDGTIPGDSSGTWDITTGAFNFEIFPAGKQASPVVPDVWGGSGGQQTTNSTNLLVNNNNLVLVTGLMLIPGSIPPNSDNAYSNVRTFDEELFLCMRYLEYQGTPNPNVLRAQVASCQVFDAVSWLVTKRVQPTIALISPTYSNGGSGAVFNGTVNGYEVSFVSTAAAPTSGLDYMTYTVSGDARL